MSESLDNITADVDELSVELADRLEDCLDDLEEAVAKLHRQLLWDSAADPVTGRQNSRQARIGYKARAVRQVAMLLERARLDGLS